MYQTKSLYEPLFSLQNPTSFLSESFLLARMVADTVDFKKRIRVKLTDKPDESYAELAKEENLGETSVAQATAMLERLPFSPMVATFFT